MYMSVVYVEDVAHAINVLSLTLAFTGGGIILAILAIIIFLHCHDSLLRCDDCSTNRVTLLYTCPKCGKTSEQALVNIVQNGTHTCDCGVDMELDDKVRIERAKAGG